MPPAFLFMVLGKFDFVWVSTPFSIPKMMDLTCSTWLIWAKAWADPIRMKEIIYILCQRKFFFPPLPEREQEKMLCGHYTTLGSYLENQFEDNC